MKKIIALSLTVLCLMSILCGCRNNKSNVLDYNNYSDSDLKKKIGEQVVLYGYFTLNSVTEKRAYVCSSPYSVVLHNLSEEDNEYVDLSLKENNAMLVFFKEEPEYTSTLIKITGTLKKTDFIDSTAGVNSVYSITDASYSFVDTYAMDTDLAYFVKFAKNGYCDVAYQNLLNMQLFANKTLQEYPSEENYEEISKELESVTVYDMPLKREYKELIEDIHLEYIKYKESYNKDKKNFDYEAMEKSVNDLLENFTNMISYYSKFKVMPDDGSGFDKLEAENHPEVITETNASTTQTNTANTTKTSTTIFTTNKKD